MAINIGTNTDGDVTYQNPPVDRTLFPNIKYGATPEEIQEAVDAWLDAHPEATTTVEDGSILPVKLVSTNSATDGYVLSYNATAEKFEWYDIGGELDGINSDITDLKQDYNQILNASFVTETVTDEPIASFSDGADDIPVKSMTVDVTPVQDLHGQANPYPAGGGVNKFDVSTVTIGKWCDNSGVISDNISGCISAPITVSGGSTFFVKEYGTSPYSKSILEYDSSDAFIVRDHKAGSGELTATLNASTAYVRVQVSSDVDVTITQSIVEGFKVVAGVGTSPASYAPYSNICPISGWTGANISATGINLWDEEWENGTINAQGQNVVGDAVRPKGYIPILPNTAYYITPVMAAVFWYDANKNIISLNYSGGERTSPSNAYYMRFYTQSAYGNTYNHDISINYPSTDTSYHAYQGETYSITFPTEAGTVYGGILDVTDGVLTVNKKVVDLGSLTWELIESFGGSFKTSISDAGYATNGDVICSNYKTVLTGAEVTSGDYVVYCKNNGLLCFIKDTTYDSASDFKTAMSGVILCYPISTPVTYQLTPTEVDTLLGQNNIFCDTGNTSVEYCADPKLYVDGKVSTAQNLMELLITANRENSMTASQAYSEGDLVIINGTLYEVASNIANGGTFTPGTNVIATTVAEQLSAIA